MSDLAVLLCCITLLGLGFMWSAVKLWKDQALETVLRAIISTFFVKGKEQVRWRDAKSGKFVKTPKFYRYAWGCKGVPAHGTYVSFTYFYWGTAKPDGEEKLLKYMEKWLDCEREDWWFSFRIGFGMISLEYDKELDGLEEYEP